MDELLTHYDIKNKLLQLFDGILCSSASQDEQLWLHFDPLHILPLFEVTDLRRGKSLPN